MERRGVLIRDVIPSEIRARQSNIRERMGDYGFDFGVKGRDATGRKSRVPWVRFFSERKSPKATVGWYVVYLFHPDASGVSLCLSHGSTTFEGGVYQERGLAEIAELVAWGYGALGDAALPSSLTKGVSLGGGKLAKSYEKTTLFSRFYPANSIPDDQILEADLAYFAGLLSELYRQDDDGLSPGSTNPEVREAAELLEELASPLRSAGRGQGRNMSPEARRAIEMRAMGVAKAWLEAQGFTSIKDVASKESWDFSAKQGGILHHIEVKGTTGGPKAVLLTRNEVKLHLQCHPHNALLVIHGIALSADKLTASGGTLLAFFPWELDESRLVPTCYEYTLG